MEDYIKAVFIHTIYRYLELEGTLMVYDQSMCKDSEYSVVSTLSKELWVEQKSYIMDRIV